MNYFLDENFPKKAGEFLQKQNHIVFDIRGSSEEGLDDIKIFNLAQKKESIFLTTDKDFFHTIHLTQKPHYGIIVITLTKPNSKNILDKLEWYLKSFPTQIMESRCVLITDKKCYIYE